MTIQRLFLTFLGAGLSPLYPKLAGTVAALVAGVILLNTLGPETLFTATLAVALIGIFEINKVMHPSEESDSAGQLADEIVIDKAAGMWLSLLIPHTTALSLSWPYTQELTVLLSFASFYLFDSWKPSTIGWISHHVKGGLGVVGSSVLAGFAGGFLTIVILLGISRLF